MSHKQNRLSNQANQDSLTTKTQTVTLIKIIQIGLQSPALCNYIASAKLQPGVCLTGKVV